jgi:hypothetical protein
MNDLAKRMTRAADELQRILRLLEKPADLQPEERTHLLALFQALLDNLRTEAWALDQEINAKGKAQSKNNPLYDRVFQMVDRRMETTEAKVPPPPPPDKRAS